MNLYALTSDILKRGGLIIIERRGSIITCYMDTLRRMRNVHEYIDYSIRKRCVLLTVDKEYKRGQPFDPDMYRLEKKWYYPGWDLEGYNITEDDRKRVCLYIATVIYLRGHRFVEHPRTLEDRVANRYRPFDRSLYQSYKDSSVIFVVGKHKKEHGGGPKITAEPFRNRMQEVLDRNLGK